jgi:hypothetical protein
MLLGAVVIFESELRCMLPGTSLSQTARSLLPLSQTARSLLPYPGPFRSYHGQDQAAVQMLT